MNELTVQIYLRNGIPDVEIGTAQNNVPMYLFAKSPCSPSFHRNRRRCGHHSYGLCLNSLTSGRRKCSRRCVSRRREARKHDG